MGTKAYIEIALTEALSADDLSSLAARALEEKRPVESVIAQAIREFLAKRAAAERCAAA